MKSDEENSIYNHHYSQAFDNNQSDDEIDPLTAAEIATLTDQIPRGNKVFKQKDPRGRIRLVIIYKTTLGYDQSRFVIPPVLQTRA